MATFLSFFAFMSLLLFAVTIAAARKDAGEYWRAAVKDQHMTEALEKLVRNEAASAGSDEKTKCHTPATIELKEEKIIIEDLERPIKPKVHAKKSTFTNDFEPRPSVTAYVRDDKSSSFADDFEPRPSLTAYVGDDKSSSFAEDFEPRPNVSAYGNDANLKGKKTSSFAEDFEPRPNVSAYGDDANLKGKKTSSFAEDFEPRPNVSAYGGHDDGAAGHIREGKSFASDFEPEPTATSYHD